MKGLLLDIVVGVLVLPLAMTLGTNAIDKYSKQIVTETKEVVESQLNEYGDWLYGR